MAWPAKALRPIVLPGAVLSVIEPTGIARRNPPAASLAALISIDPRRVDTLSFLGGTIGEKGGAGSGAPRRHHGADSPGNPRLQPDRSEPRRFSTGLPRARPKESEARFAGWVHRSQGRAIRRPPVPAWAHRLSRARSVLLVLSRSRRSSHSHRTVTGTVPCSENASASDCRTECQFTRPGVRPCAPSAEHRTCNPEHHLNWERTPCRPCKSHRRKASIPRLC